MYLYIEHDDILLYRNEDDSWENDLNEIAYAISKSTGRDTEIVLDILLREIELSDRPYLSLYSNYNEWMAATISETSDYDQSLVLSVLDARSEIEVCAEEDESSIDPGDSDAYGLVGRDWKVIM